jgi:hypothetical protein
MVLIQQKARAIEERRTVDEKQTVQEFEPDSSIGRYDSGYNYLFYRDAILPPWGAYGRQRKLLDFYYDPYNWAVQGAFAAIAKQVASTPYEIKGDKEHKILVRHFEDVLSGAQFDDFGGGFRGFIMRLVLDFLRFDEGAYAEIIGPGDSKGSIKGRVTGVAQLNAMRCVNTGNPDHPVVYYGRRTGQLHKMSRYRVARLIDMPDGTDDETGRGLSALSRVISIASSMNYQIRYNIQRLDDLPPAGILAINNVRNWDDQMALYEGARQRDGGDVWANVMVLQGIEPDKPVMVEHTPFADESEHFNFKEYTEVMVNALALALNVDPQDIWPLTGSALGTGTQSSILHTKAAGKMLGDLRTLITRMINFHILPPSLEFQFKYKDTERDKEDSLNQDRYSIIAKRIQDIIDPLGTNDQTAKEVALQYLATSSEVFADVLYDSEGGLRLPSDDPKIPDQEDTTFTDSETMSNAPESGGDLPQDEVTSSSETPLKREQKAIQSTRLDFEGDVEDAIKAAMNGDITRRRFGIVMRAHLAKYGRQAFQDGLKDGGVDAAPSDADIATIAAQVAQQSQYVTQLGDAIYNQGITEAQALQKPAMWYNKSITPFYNEGVASADKNGMYEWVLGATEEHCSDCLRLNGQRHRMKDWIKSGWIPQADKLGCNGFNCDCKLKRVRGRARGRF